MFCKSNKLKIVDPSLKLESLSLSQKYSFTSNLKLIIIKDKIKRVHELYSLIIKKKNVIYKFYRLLFEFFFLKSQK